MPASAPPFNAQQRRAVVWAIWLQAAILSWLSHAWIYPGLISIWTLLVARRWVTWPWPLSSSRGVWYSLILAVPFAMQWSFWPYDPQHLRVFVLYSLTFATALYGLTWQALYLTVKDPQERWSLWWPVSGILVLLSAGNVQTTRHQTLVYLGTVLVYLAFVGRYVGADRQWIVQPSKREMGHRRLAHLLVTTLTAGVICFTSTWFFRNYHELERLYLDWMTGDSTHAGAGFDRNAQLGAYRPRESWFDQTPALRIFSPETPGYMRGAVFDEYRAGHWANRSIRNSYVASEVPPGLQKLMPGLTYFSICPSDGTPSPPSWEIWPAGYLKEAVFTPWPYRAVGVPDQLLTVDLHHIIYPQNHLPGQYYQIYPGGVIEDLHAEPELPELPVRRGNLKAWPISDQVRRLSQELFEDCPTDQAKVDRLVAWFRDNFQYGLSFQPPAGLDPVDYFLHDKGAAHCEFFAAATVQLLKAAGVESRYVTGYYVTERNPYGGYWVARQRDAHAWVEAWIEGKGWQTVETTPEAGIPNHAETWALDHLWDDFLQRLQRLRSGTVTGGWRSLKLLLGGLLTTPVGWTILTVLGVWISWGLYRIWPRNARRKRKSKIPAATRQYWQPFARALRKHDIIRSADETLHHFAQRLKELARDKPQLESSADWCLNYAECRYRSGEALDTDLMSQLPQVIRDLSR